VSQSYAFLQTVITNHGASSLSILDPHGFFIHATSLIATLTNNFAKGEWDRVTTLRDDMGRMDAGKIKVSDLFTAKNVRETSVSMRNFVSQMLYLIPYTIRLPAYTFSSETGRLAGIGLVLASIPVAQYLVARYAQYLAKKKEAEVPNAFGIADRYSKPWQKTKALLSKYFSFLKGSETKSCEEVLGNLEIQKSQTAPVKENFLPYPPND
jgi:hypothetical protein